MSETVTMTLTDFLLARIAEDEESAGRLHEMGCERLAKIPFPCDCGIPRRVVAEVAAKRAIVGLSCADYHVLELLARPYADHPDFDPAWGAL